MGDARQSWCVTLAARRVPACLSLLGTASRVLCALREFESLKVLFNSSDPKRGISVQEKKMQTLSHRTNIVNYVIINGSP